PVLFLGHSDVVSVERDRWSVDPFGAEVKDGWLYGRGSLDMKGADAAVVTALLRHVSEGGRFDRDVIYLSDCDEEVGPNGTRWLAEHHWPKIDAGAVITEGGWILTRPDGRPMLATVTVQDKSATGLDLVALGTATHSSKPMPDSAIVRMDRAVSRLADYRAPVTLPPLGRVYFEALAGAVEQGVVQGHDDPGLARALRGLLSAADPDRRPRGEPEPVPVVAQRAAAPHRHPGHPAGGIPDQRRSGLGDRDHEPASGPRRPVGGGHTGADAGGAR